MAAVPRRGRFMNDSGSTSSLLRVSARGSGIRDSHATEDIPLSLVGDSTLSSISDKFSLSPDIRQWGFDLSPDLVEADDALHNPDARDVKNGRYSEHDGHPFSSRGFANLGCLFILCAGILMLFLGYPILTFVQDNIVTNTTSAALSTANVTVPSMGNFGLIDADTPEDAYTKTSWMNSSDEWVLVFSDEFNTDNRSFYPGDDPYWEAHDLHNWATNDLEWYDPAAITTYNGSLIITLSELATHDLDYQSGLMTTWNKFCFTGGLIEASVSLPGSNDISGLWPAVWTMGNLGRTGYGATTEGMWPYTYDSCDVGTAPNQTLNGLPLLATTSGSDSYDGELSYLPGQRLSRCTCSGESHPGPVHDDGTYVGRAAPEIDMFEAQITDDSGQVSQSGQWAPFDSYYMWDNTTENLIIANASLSALNSYLGGAYQQASSVVTETNQACYENNGDCYALYGFQYKPGYEADDAYITWISDNKLSWTMNAAGVGANDDVEISARPVPQEPMYIITNLGLSTNFATIDWTNLVFPVHMKIDYIRVYQAADSINVGCSPDNFPTEDYINTYIEAYENPNITTWHDDFGQDIPKNSWVETC